MFCSSACKLFKATTLPSAIPEESKPSLGGMKGDCRTF